jgi:hypothetical protein
MMKRREFLTKLSILGALGALALAGGGLVRGALGFELQQLAPSVIDPIALKGMGDFRGKSVTMFHLSARPATLGMGRLVIKSVKRAPVRAEINARGEARFPKTVVEAGGFDAFNYLMFVVHEPSQANVYVKNSDGKPLADPRVADGDWARVPAEDFAHLESKYVGLIKLDQIRQAQGNPAEISLDFASDF